MTAIASAIASNVAAVEASPARLYLDPKPSPERSIDGAWWPHSRDVAAESAILVAGIGESLGPIDRLAFNVDDWPDHPRRLRVGERTIKLGFFHCGPNLVSLVRRRGDNLVLLVIPPGLADDEAVAVLAGATDSGDRSTAAELLAAVHRQPVDPSWSASPLAVSTGPPDRPTPPPRATASGRGRINISVSRTENPMPALAVWEGDGGATAPSGGA